MPVIRADSGNAWKKQRNINAKRSHDWIQRIDLPILGGNRGTMAEVRPTTLSFFHQGLGPVLESTINTAMMRRVGRGIAAGMAIGGGGKPGRTGRPGAGGAFE